MAEAKSKGMFPWSPWLVIPAVLVLVPLGLVSFHYAFNPTKAHRLVLILLPATLVITAIGSLTAPQGRAASFENSWYVPPNEPSGGVWKAFAVTLDADSHVDVEIRFLMSFYGYRGESYDYEFHLRDVNNATIAQSTGPVHVAEILADGGRLGAPIHLHFDVPKGGGYRLLFRLEVSYSVASRPTVLSTPLWFDRAGPVLLLVSGVGTLLASATVWIPTKKLRSRT